MRKHFLKGTLAALCALVLPLQATNSIARDVISDPTAMELNAIALSKHVGLETMDVAKIGCHCYEPGLFVSGLADYSRVSTTVEDAGSHSDIYGGIVGANFRLCDWFGIGANFTYAHTHTYMTHDGKSNTNNYRIGLVAAQSCDCFHIEETAGYTWSRHTSHRATADDVFADGKTRTNTFDAMVRAGYDLWCVDIFGPVHFGPMAQFQYTNFRMKDFTERGPSALHYRKSTTDSYQGTFGIESCGSWCLGCWTIDGDGFVAWQHEFGKDRKSFDVVSDGVPTDLRGSLIGRDALVFYKAVTFRRCECFFITISNYSEFRRHYTTTDFSLRLTWLY